LASGVEVWLDRVVAGTVQPGGGLLTALLRDVSRSFYLTMRVLPSGVRHPISLAYLLARASDTIADSAGVPVARRLEALSLLRSRVRGELPAPLDFSDMVRDASSTPGERILLARIEEAIACLGACDEFERVRIREVLEVITGGQELDLRRFETGEAGAVRSLSTAAELDDYTYRVAGCVGEFWTHVCRRGVFPRALLDDRQLMEDGIRFGKGLQLVNILRDLPRDLAAGRCYLPADELRAVGLEPSDLRDPASEGRFRPVYDRWLAQAEDHLAAGWRYARSLPAGCLRLRLACAWPVLIGIRTTARLASTRVLDPAKRVKVSRGEVRAILWATLWRLPSRPAWERLFETTRRQADAATTRG
jgi:farnesyl-diphosphate farnesyltransferase